MCISIIIPTYNEQSFIESTINSTKERACYPNNLRFIVADGGSTDATLKKAKAAGAQVLRATKARRSMQLNQGAQTATCDILYFLHADTIPPKNFDALIRGSIKEGNSAGCFRLSFDHSHPLLRFFAWWTWFDFDAFRYGDQSLFITRETFHSIGGYRNELHHMEDQNIVRRIKKSDRNFALLPAEVTTSARKYLRNGLLRLQVIFILIFVLYKVGLTQEKLGSFYKKWVH